MTANPGLGRRLVPARRAGGPAIAALLVLATACGGGDGAALSGSPGSARVPASPATTGAAPRTAITTTTVAGPPMAATTPEDLATQLATVETAIRSPATPAADLPRLGHTEQLATAALASHPDWEGVVLPLLPPAARTAVEANIAANRDLRVLSSGEPKGLPKWHIVAPPAAPDLLGEYKAAEAATGVPWQFLAAIHLVESRMGRIRGNSSAGAQGPMQFLPSTWAAYGGGGDINSYHDSILAAAGYLKANGAPANMDNALFRYNPSNRYVRAITNYAGQMKADERAYLGYYHWQVYYFDTWLPEGYVG